MFREFATAAIVVSIVSIDTPEAIAQADTAQLREWEVPWENSRPRDPYVATDGRVWFVGQRSHYAAVLDPETGDMRRYDLIPDAGPHNLIVDEEGLIWYAGNRQAHIGVLNPSNGNIEIIPMPDPQARDPHTLVWAPDGNIWFTVQQGNMVGHLNRETRDVRLVEMTDPRSRPYGIKVDDTGRPWFTEFGTNKIGTVDPATMELTEFELPREDARPRRIGITSDGSIWYVDYAQGYVGKLDPMTGAFEEWRTPRAATSLPYGMAVDRDDRIWFVETTAPNQFVGFDPHTEEFVSISEVPSGGGTIRHMFYDETNNTIWFGTDANTVGQATLPPVSGREATS